MNTSAMLCVHWCPLCCADFNSGSFAHEKRVVWVLHIKKNIVWVFSVAGIQFFFLFFFFWGGGVRVPSVFFASSLNFACQNTVIIN